ncbi:MAG TPA: 2,3-diphosphoglycerate synthetase [Acidimicrobiia bacterium]|nr:2,3-diphosphoglycerate synthetase [Acidimicrobiia bacterium]
MSAGPASPRVLVLVDGEHYPPVVRAAIDELRAAGSDIVGAAVLGGTEKVSTGEQADFGVPAVTGSDPLDALLAGLDRFHPDEVFDLSDQPVLDARLRMRLAAHALARDVAYAGADFRFVPPPNARLATKPSIAIVGTGKRTGKTAVSAHLARLLKEQGTPPVIVAMGRGGPHEPELVDPAESAITSSSLLALAEEGRHAASDHLEGGLMAGVTTIGTRRAGGGMVSTPASSTFPAGVELANTRREPIVIFEGSGAAVPPAHADATVLVVPASADIETVTGYLGPFLLLKADLVVVTLASPPLQEAAHALEDRIRELVPATPLVRTTFRPHPLEPLSGRTVFFATTAPSPVASELAAHLEHDHGARVVGVSTHLSNRSLLSDDLQAADGAEVLVTELKAAAVDVATKVAIDRGMHVVYCDNRPVSTEAETSVDDLLLDTARLAVERFARPAS